MTDTLLLLGWSGIVLGFWMSLGIFALLSAHVLWQKASGR